MEWFIKPGKYWFDLFWLSSMNRKREDQRNLPLSIGKLYKDPDKNKPSPGGESMSAKKPIKEKYSETQRRILRHLRVGLRAGKSYFKSKYIALDLGLSPKEVGTNLAILSEICDDLDIKRWSYSSSTTWRVTPRPS